MKNIININVLASIMKGLGMEEYEIDRVLEYSSIEELLNADGYSREQYQAIVSLLTDDLLSDTLFTKIKEVMEGHYSYDTSIRRLKKAKDGSYYLVFYLDFDEHYDYLYMDVQSAEIIGNQDAFIDYLLNR